MLKPKLFLIGGPTASGKSAAAVELARQENGVIINADAMQVYAGLPILTAQPGAQEMSETPHEMYAIADVSDRFSVGKWLSATKDAIKRTKYAGRTPILVGGTGLYFKALIEGLAEIPDIPAEVRADVQELYSALGSEAFRQKLALLDPVSAEKIKSNDKQRLIRAYEVALHTGKPIGYWQKPPYEPPSFRRMQENAADIQNDFTVKKILIMPKREELYSACDNRFKNMIKLGATNEVSKLLVRNLSCDLPAMKILGVREITAYLRKEIPIDEAITKAQQSTRNYAKRQMTWFRNQWQETEQY